MPNKSLKRQNEAISRKKKTLIKNIHKFGKLPGIDVAFTIRQCRYQQSRDPIPHNGHQAGGDISYLDSKGQTLLHLAVRSGSEETVALLLARGMAISAADLEGATALHLAARDGHEELIHLLIDNGAETTAKGNLGRTPLHCCAESGHGVATKLLADRGSPLSATGNAGRTARELAQVAGSDRSMRALDDEPLSISIVQGHALDTKVSYGIFECFLHRSLLWQPAQNTLTQIPYNSKAPPSWSWMAYHGQIKYLQIGFGSVEWDISVRLVDALPFAMALRFVIPSNYVLQAQVRRLRDSKIKLNALFDEWDNQVGQLYFDTQPGNVLPDIRCAIMGRETGGEGDGGSRRKYYVLFVTECATSWGCEKFRRVGMGWIQKRFIQFDGQDDKAQIL